MAIEEPQTALDHHAQAYAAGRRNPFIDPLAEAARLVANPNLRAMGITAFKINPYRFSEAELQEIVAAAFTPQGDT